MEIGGESALETASGVTVLFMSLLVLLYGSYVLIVKPPVLPPVKDIKSHEDYIAALHQYKNVKALNKDILLAIDQLERMEKKRITLLDVLGQRFDQTELSYKKFISVIYEVGNLFYLNIRGILNKLRVFDASEFSAIASPQRTAPFSNQLQEKMDLYKEYLAYVTGYLGANEEILLKLDKLLLEISQLGQHRLSRCRRYALHEGNRFVDQADQILSAMRGRCVWLAKEKRLWYWGLLQ